MQLHRHALAGLLLGCTLLTNPASARDEIRAVHDLEGFADVMAEIEARD
jgi:hypothetical protein